MNELERYGIIPSRWYFEEDDIEGPTVILITDVGSIHLPLSSSQVTQLKDKMDFYRKHVGREWKDGILLIPAKEHKQQ